MSKTTFVKQNEHGTELDGTNTTDQFKQGGHETGTEIEDFWQPGMGVWSDRQLSGNKMLRMHGVVTGTLSRLIIPSGSPASSAVSKLKVRVRWDGLESDALLDPNELVPYLK